MGVELEAVAGMKIAKSDFFPVNVVSLTKHLFLKHNSPAVPLKKTK